MAKYPTFQEPKLQALCDVLGATDTGLTGSEIDQLLSACRIDDPHPGLTKRHRLFEALQARQTQDQCSNAVLNFVHQAMDPVTYRGCADLFKSRRHDLNIVLAFAVCSLVKMANYVPPRKRPPLTRQRTAQIAWVMNCDDVPSMRMSGVLLGRTSAEELFSCCPRSHQERFRENSPEIRP